MRHVPLLDELAIIMVLAVAVTVVLSRVKLAGVGLAQFGEFGFVLARLAQSSGVVDEEAVRPALICGAART